MRIPNRQTIEKPLSRLFIPEPYRNEYDFIEDHLLMAIRQLQSSTSTQFPHRRLKIRQGYRDAGPEARKFPEILIRGVWLEKFGFEREKHIHIIPFRNILVICQE